jgi:Cu(I)/Ag(I) efflux system membrane protein CusA/SilA
MNALRFCLALAACSLARAQAPLEVRTPIPPAAATAASAASTVLTDGVVQSIDSASGVVTLEHDEIANMHMPAMTMTFGVVDKKMLEHLKSGDKVKFRVEMFRNAPTVMRLELAR